MIKIIYFLFIYLLLKEYKCFKSKNLLVVLTNYKTFFQHYLN